MRNLSTHPLRKILSGVIVLSLALTLSSCGAWRFGYHNADSLSYWWLNRYVNFSDEQSHWVKEELVKFFAWHRSTQLSEYVQLLERAQGRIDRGQALHAADIERDMAQVKQSLRRDAEQALPALSRLALSLSPQQIDHIARRFEANNDKFRKEHLRGGPEERREQRFEKVMKHAEYWFGDFNKAQRERIRAASDARPLDNELWLAERQRRQQALLTLLRKIQKERPSREATAQMLRAYVERALDNFSYEEHKAFFDSARRETVLMTAAIVNMANTQQKTHARKRLQKLIEDGYELVGKEVPQRLSMQRAGTTAEGN